mgnify:CR=1 FL=1
MRTSLLNKILAGIFALSLTSPMAFAENDKSQMWSSLEIASDTAVFTINLPQNGCVSIYSETSAKKKTERIWGPRFMEKGTYKLKFPESKVKNKKGSIELFNLKLTPEKITGTRGNGERQFNTPTGLDFDESRREILIADSGNDRIIRLGKDGRFLGKHGGFGLTMKGGSRSDEKEDSLDNPYDVAAGGFSNFYVSDQNNERVAIFDSYKSYRGNLYPSKDDRRNRLSRPRGIITDYENNIWVVDGRADVVYKISPSGSKILEIGGFGYTEQQLKSPTQVDIGLDGSVYVADRGKGRIAVFDRLGSYKYEIKNHLESPTGICIDDENLLFVCDDTTNELSLYTPQGVRLDLISEASDGSTFRKPSDIAGTDDWIYLLDTGNHRIIHIKRQKEGYTVSWQGPSTVLE